MHRINENIVSNKVRLVGKNVEVGIYYTKEALKIASNNEMDLVEINPKSNPPICKILEYKKFLYEQKKKQKQFKTKQDKVSTKEIRLGPQTSDHDLKFKIKNSKKFLESKEKVKFSLFFKGRSIIYKEHGKLLLLRCASALSKYCKMEQSPIMEGKKMFMILSPKKGN